MGAGRFAPSPTGDLHLGNLRTALLAWLFARHRGDRFLLRFEDLESSVVRSEAYVSQLEDLVALGLDPDEPPMRQSDDPRRYRDVVDRLTALGFTYRCFCSRREIREAAAAPNGPWAPGAYPGTCRDLSDDETQRRVDAGRPAALRLRTPNSEVTIVDDLIGEFTGLVDDFVLQRRDGTPAYNLCVVIDDDAQGITQVVRGDDLLSSTPRQVHVARLLGIRAPRYAHVPLVLGTDLDRLAKRHGAVTLREIGATATQVRTLLAASLGLCTLDEVPSIDELLDRFDPTALPTTPWIYPG